MDLEKSGTVQEKDTKGSLLKVVGLRGCCTRKMEIVSKWGDDLYYKRSGYDLCIFYFHY